MRFTPLFHPWLSRAASGVGLGGGYLGKPKVGALELPILALYNVEMKYWAQIEFATTLFLLFYTCDVSVVNVGGQRSTV